MFSNKCFKFEILNSRGSDLIRWNELLENVAAKDIYFSPEYMELFGNTHDEESKNFGGEPQLAFFGDEEHFILYPFFKRQICQLDFYKELSLNYGQLYDIVSPWYFSGMLYHTDPHKFDDQLLADLTNRFLAKFNDYCVSNNIVSEFMRLHPFINNGKLVQSLDGTVKKSSDVVYIDLSVDAKKIHENFTKPNRNCISKSKRNNVHVFLSTDAYYIDEFYRLYTSNMDRLNASKKYYFSQLFFYNLFKLLSGNSTLFVAEYDGKVIAASLFIYKYGFVHYYLSASDPNFNKLCPVNLIIHEAIMWAKEKGNRILELGGGYDLNDSLSKFKSSFSKDSIDFYTYSKIHNGHMYKLLCDARDEYDRINGNPENIRSNYFPAYRR
jgi:hypothetical protein